MYDCLHGKLHTTPKMKKKKKKNEIFLTYVTEVRTLD
jgi:hypothetical protein